MKVFAIVNNCRGDNTEGEPGWFFIADSAVTNTGKPFYLPEIEGDVTASLCLAVRISRLGKYVDKKFSYRYFSECAPAVHFRCLTFGEELQKDGLPEDAALSFDRCLFVGEFSPVSDFEEVEMIINGEKKVIFNLGDLKHSIEELISRISVMNTIKMGDLLLPALKETGVVKRGDVLEINLKKSFGFRVKVK